MLKKLSSIFAILVLFTNTYSQRIFTLDNFTTENGLSSNYTECSYIDKYGYLWIGTWSGLNRFDGYSFKAYNKSILSKSSIAGDFIYYIREDRQGNLWIAANGGISIYDRNTDAFTSLEELNGAMVRSFADDRKGIMWITSDHGLFLYNLKSKEIKKYRNVVQKKDTLFTDDMYSVYIDDQDNVWIATFDKGLVRYNQSTKIFTAFDQTTKFENCQDKNKIYCMLFEDNGWVWLGTFNNGLFKFNYKTGQCIYFETDESDIRKINSKSIRSISRDKEGNVWISCLNGYLNKYNPTRNSFDKFINGIDNTSALDVKSISSVMNDLYGNYWITTHGSGVLCINKYKNSFKSFIHIPENKYSLSNNMVSSFVELDKNTIFIGTDGGGVNIFNTNTFTFEQLKHTKNLQTIFVTSIVKDKNGKIWYSKWGDGITMYDPKTGNIRDFKHKSGDDNSLINNFIKGLYANDTVIWIASHGEGISYLDLRNYKLHSYKNSENKPFSLKVSLWVNSFLADSKGRFWISSQTGLYLWDKEYDYSFTHSDKDFKSVISNMVKMVYEDTKHRMWVLTDNGIDLYDETNRCFEHYSILYNLPMTAKAMTEDSSGNLWISTNEGIVKFVPETKKKTIYNINDGLSSNSFYPAAILKTSSGHIYFGGLNGFTFFHPDSIFKSNEKLNVYLTGFQIDYKDIPWNDGKSILKCHIQAARDISLKYSQQVVSYMFTGIYFSNPNKLTYYYKLEGYNDKWISLGSERKISFSGLAPGSYTLKIKTRNEYNETGNNGSGLYITVLPPWWMSRWFKILSGLIIGLIAFTMYLLWVKSVTKRHKILEENVRLRTFELNEKNHQLTEQNEKIEHQNYRLEQFNGEILNMSSQIVTQQEIILHQNQELEARNTELNQLNKTKDKLFSIIAHDLKNPVGSITGLAQLLSSKFTTMAEDRKLLFVKNIEAAAESITTLLINLLDWSRTQSGQIIVKPVEFPLADVVVVNLMLFKQQCALKDVETKSDVPVHITMSADRNMIDTVVRNLLSNAIKFTPRGGQILISAYNSSDELIISVKDSGVGMSQDKLSTLFNEETNNSTVGTSKEKGTGLGLIICKEFVEKNKGEISVESTPGYGTTFILKFPVYPPK